MASGVAANAQGGAVVNYTGFDQNLTISNSVFTGNSSLAGMGANAYAGAVVNYQTMTISNSLFTANSTVGGAMPSGNPSNSANSGQALGGAIYTGGGSGVILTLSNSTVAGNEAMGGSGGSTLVYPRTGNAVELQIADLHGRDVKRYRLHDHRQ